MGFLNSDDCFFDDKVISNVVKEFKLNNNIDAVYGDMAYINKNKIITRHWKANDYYSNAFIYGWSLPFPTFYLKRSCFTRYGKFNLKHKICDDYEFTFRLIHIHKIKISRINKTMILFNDYGRSSNLISRVSALIDILSIFRLYSIKINIFTFIIKRYIGKIKQIKF